MNRIPIMAKQVLDLYELYRLVVARGGLVEVINKKIWREITKGLNLPSSITSAAFTLRTQYDIPYHTIPFHIIPFPTILYHIIPFPTILYHIIPFLTIPALRSTPFLSFLLFTNKAIKVMNFRDLSPTNDLNLDFTYKRFLQIIITPFIINY